MSGDTLRDRIAEAVERAEEFPTVTAFVGTLGDHKRTIAMGVDDARRILALLQEGQEPVAFAPMLKEELPNGAYYHKDTGRIAAYRTREQAFDHMDDPSIEGAEDADEVLVPLYTHPPRADERLARLGWVVVPRRDGRVLEVNRPMFWWSREDAEEDQRTAQKLAGERFTYTVHPVCSTVREDGERRYTLDEIDAALYDAHRAWDASNMRSLSDLLADHLRALADTEGGA